jgi:hypothetical protein
LVDMFTEHSHFVLKTLRKNSHNHRLSLMLLESYFCKV